MLESAPRIGTYCLKDPSTRYCLAFPLDNYNEMYFFYRHPELDLLVTTSRDIDDYQRVFANLPLRSGLCYHEIGGGLGGLLNHLISQFPKNPKPVLIDPFSYKTALRILEEAINIPTLPEPQSTVPRIKELIERCHVALDPSKVTLLTMTIEEAVTRHPELIASADVTVNLLGTSGHLHLQEKLLKPDGQAFRL